MRRIRYAVAMSLDGYLAGPNGEADWIITNPEIDFGALFREFDTFLVGRRTFEAMAHGGGGGGELPGTKTYVFSRTLRQSDHSKVTIVDEVSKERVEAIRAAAKKDIWLFGGGSLFRSLAEAGLVDTVEVSIIPVLLGEGIPLVPPPALQTKLELVDHKIYKATGIVSLQYAVKK